MAAPQLTAQEYAYFYTLDPQFNQGEIYATLHGEKIGSASVPWGVLVYVGRADDYPPKIVSGLTFNCLGLYIQAFRRDTLALGPVLKYTVGYLSEGPPWVSFPWNWQNNCVYSDDHFLLGLGDFSNTYPSTQLPHELAAFQVNADLSVTALWTAPSPSGWSIVGVEEMPAHPGHVLTSIRESGSVGYTRWWALDTATQTFTDLGLNSLNRWVNRLTDYGDATNLLADDGGGLYCVVAPSPTAVTEVGAWQFDSRASLGNTTMDYVPIVPGSSILVAAQAVSTGSPAWFGFSRLDIASDGSITFTIQHFVANTWYGGWAINGDTPAGGIYPNGAGAIAIFPWEDPVSYNNLLYYTQFDGTSWTDGDLTSLDWWTNSQDQTILGSWPGASPGQMVIAVTTEKLDYTWDSTHPIGAVKLGIISFLDTPNLTGAAGPTNVHFW